jgi:hypothetical protein
MEGTLQKIQDDEDRFSDIFYNQPDSKMANPVFDHLRDDRRRFGEIHNSGSLLFQGDRGVSPSISANVSNQDFSINQNSSGDLRLSMPAPKRTLPTSIVDSLNEDSLFFTGGQQHVFGSGLGSPYLHPEISATVSHSNNNLYMLGGEQLDNDSDFDKRGPRSFSLGEDTFPVSTVLPSAEFLYNRPASTPLSATFSSSSSSQILQYQQNSPNNQSSQFHRQLDVGNHSTLQQQYEPDMPYNRSIAQQQQVYPQHVPPSNLQIHLADIDRRMEIRRGKSAGPGSGPYDGSPMAHGTGDSNNSASMRQQQALASNRSGNAMPNFRPHVQIETMMMQQRPASTPLPMSLPSNNMHHTHQPSPEHAKPHGPPLLNLCGLEDSSVEDIVAKSCRDILIDAASHSLKAVELANTLRARVGTEVLAHIRERWGGLLSLLERHTHVFRVERIPKNDLVTLVGGVTSSGGQVAQTAAFRGGRPLPTPTFIGQPQGQGQGGSDQGQGQGQGPFYNGAGTQSHSSSASPASSIVRTLSPPLTSSSASASMAFYHPHYGSSGAGDYMVPGGSAGSGEGTVSRCLHVGNVPANMTETQLLRELERYGDVDCLKLGESY